MKQNLFIACILGVSVLAIAQQQPKVVNAQFHTEPAGAGLSATVDRFQHANGPLWLGYEVPALARTHFSVCSDDTQSSMDDGCCGEYQLEDSEHGWQTSDDHNQIVTSIDILLRIDQGAVQNIRFVPVGCRLNAGGLPFTWLTGVDPDDSVTYLASLISPRQQTSHRRSPCRDCAARNAEGDHDAGCYDLFR